MLHVHQVSSEPEFRSLQPARIVTEHALERAFRSGMVEIEFAGRAEPHALAYATKVRPRSGVFIYHSGVRSRMHRAMRHNLLPLARQLMGHGERRLVLMER
jgi:hypothetical protein